MKIRRSAIYGGLIPDTDGGKARIRFVTEGEASLHACVLNGLAADVLSVRISPIVSYVVPLKPLKCRTRQILVFSLLMLGVVLLTSVHTRSEEPLPW